VSEYTTGRHIASGWGTRRAAIEKARKSLERAGMEEFRAILSRYEAVNT
jgi:hypothetical protein